MSGWVGEHACVCVCLHCMYTYNANTLLVRDQLNVTRSFSRDEFTMKTTLFFLG